VRREHRSGEEEKRLIELTEQLNKLGCKRPVWAACS
jgi:hypothetical protein